MSTLQMLDVLIGIIFIYLLLSFICTAINEIIEGMLKKRGADLHRGVCELLQANDDNKLMEKFYGHPLISGLFKGSYTKGSIKNLPSYIPARNFSLALLDIILPASETNLSGAGGGVVTRTIDGVSVPIDRSNPMKPLRDAVLKWTDSNARQAVLALVDAAEGDIEQVRQNIETWFNNSMDRVAGWYKRRVQIILLFLGIVLAGAMNADTIAIFKSLMNDPVLRSSLVAASQELATRGTDSSGTAEERVQTNIKRLNELRLPIGWDWESPQKNGPASYLTNYQLAIPGTWKLWLLKIIGWLITGLAVSLGAPFWFDMLNKVMVIRSTVKPHEKSPEEPSQDS